MGFKFRKSRRSIKIFPGVRLNTGKKGINSVSIGGRGKGLFGATTNINLNTGKTKTTYRVKGVGSFEHMPDPPKMRRNPKDSPKPNTTRQVPPPSPKKSQPRADAIATSHSQRWYETSWFVILSIIVFPPLGIAAIWSARWSKTWKISSTVIAAIWTLILFIDAPTQQFPEPVTTAPEVEAVAEVPVKESPERTSPSSDITSWDTVFQEAGRLAETAQGLAENALSPTDWELIASRLERSVQLYSSIPESSPNYPDAQAALETLNRQLFYAQKGQAVPEDTFPQAINAATKAANLTQAARTNSDWEEVATTWQNSIDLLKLVPEDLPHSQTARAKIIEYEKNLQYAQARTVESAAGSVVGSQGPGGVSSSGVGSTSSGSGNCDYPWQLDNAGNRCGDRAASEREGGRLGGPSSTSPSSGSSGSNCHYVSGYTRKDGTRVRGHTRCR